MSLRISSALKELRIHLCQTGKASSGVREWIKQNYVDMKKANPTFPILIRECNGIQPRVWARYEKGVENSASLTDLASSDVTNAIQKLAK